MTTLSSPRASRRPALAADIAIALAGTLAFVVFHAARGFPSLADSGGDNDSLLRLVQVRDLLAGQGWFDPTQYRMGLEGGFPMHWSRLIDLPIAMLVTIFGETAALVIWPMLLFALCLFLIVSTARRIGGAAAVLPASITGALSLYFVNVFRPGALDHHNTQLALMLLAVYAFARAVRGDDPARGGAVAGLCAALMLAIGMEAAPYAAAACLLAALFFLSGGKRGIRIARGFGVAFATAGVLALVTTLPAREWLAVQCDALSFPQGSLALLGGGGLALIASVSALTGSVRTRVLALAGLGMLAALLAVTGFPQCLGDPYAGLDPVLRQYWLGSVTEAQSFVDLVRARDIATLAGFYVTPIIAMLVIGRRGARGLLSLEEAVIAAFLVFAFLVSLWQVRGGVFSLPLAAIVLAMWIGRVRTVAEMNKSARAQLAMAGAWIVSFSLVWQFAAVSLNGAISRDVATEAADAKKAACYALADYGVAATLPAGTVLTISNLGSSMLHETPHRVLNGPYHRNNAGNRAALDILMGEADKAEATMRALGIDYIALCRGNAETAAIASWAPDGFLAKLMVEQPDWLTSVAGTESANLEIFRVTRR